MAARWPSASDFGAHTRHCVGVRPLLRRHHGCELEIPLYHPHRFLNRDYIVFDCGGVAFSEAGFHASIAIGRKEDSNCATTKSFGCGLETSVFGMERLLYCRRSSKPVML